MRKRRGKEEEERGKEEEEREGTGETERTGGRLLLSAILNWALHLIGHLCMMMMLFLYAMTIVQFVVISVTSRRCHTVARGEGHPEFSNFSRCRQIDVAT